MNSQVTQEIINALKLDINVENVPAPLPVIEVGVKSVKNAIVRGTAMSSSTGATIYTTPEDQDFYLTAAEISYACDASSTSNFVNITFTDSDGISRTILHIYKIPLVVNDGRKVINFSHPIKVKRGTNIQLVSQTSVAVINAAGVIYGFIDEIS